jgi:hypothetical protein
MIYTIGHRESYLKAREEGQGVVGKLGRKEDYCGGIVFQTRVGAQSYIDSPSFKQKGFAVFAVDADWEKDTYAAKGEYGVFNYLIRDAPLVFDLSIACCGKCRDGSPFVAKVGEVYRVRCGNPDCGAAGGSSPDPEEAKRLWNRRDELDYVYELAELRMDRPSCDTLRTIIDEVIAGTGSRR